MSTRHFCDACEGPLASAMEKQRILSSNYELCVSCYQEIRNLMHDWMRSKKETTPPAPSPRVLRSTGGAVFFGREEDCLDNEEGA